MTYTECHRLFKGSQFLNYFLFCLIFLFVCCESQTLKTDDELIKEKLRPLKYSKDCKEFCKKITCKPIEECESGVVLKNESYCGCCEACVIFLDKGDSCKDQIKGSLALGSQRRCKSGTICKNGKCELTQDEKGLENCLLHQDIRNNHKQSGKYDTEIWIPECDREGNYEAKQIKGLKSLCFNKIGYKIFGSPAGTLEKHCVCSRYMEKKEKTDSLMHNLKPQEHCAESGSFDTLQCIGNLCYCVDAISGQMKSGLVRLDYLDKLPCYNNRSHSKTYLKNCERELQRSKKLTHEFWKKGVTLLGMDWVKCDPDGSFSQKQCLPDKCVCTDKMGTGIASYYADKEQILEVNMSCTCARDQISTPFMSLSCEKFGGYFFFSCFGDKCVCVDEDGETISKGLEKSDKDACKKLITDLSNYPENDDKSTSDSEYDYT